MNAPSTSRFAAGEWIQTVLLGANLVWTTLCLGGYRAETMAVTVGLTGVLLALHGGLGAVQAGARRGVHPAGWWLLPFLGYAALNVALVSPVPWLGGRDWLGWANLAATFWLTLNAVRSSRARRVLFYVLVGLGLTGVLLACYQRFAEPEWLMLGRRQVAQFVGRASGPFGIPNSFAGFLVLLLPALGALTFRRGASAVSRVWWGWTTLVFALGLLLTLSRGAWLGLALALTVWPLATSAWTWKRRVLIALLALVALGGTGTVVYHTAPDARERLERLARDAGELSRPILWRAAWNMFLDRPVTGTGAGSYSVLFEAHRPAGFVDDPQWAHNDYLNTLSDYGAVGFALWLGGVAVLGCRRRGRSMETSDSRGRDWIASGTLRSAFAIGLLAFAAQLLVEFHLKIPALAMAAAVVGALALGSERESAGGPRMTNPVTSPAARWIWGGVALGAGLAILPAVRFLAAEALRSRARETAERELSRPQPGNRGPLERAEADLRRAVAWSPGNGNAWSDLAFVLELQAWRSPERVAVVAGPAEAAARQAIARSAVVSEFWIRHGVALDLLGRREEAERAFERVVQLAPAGGAGWYYYAFHLARDTNRREEALGAIAKCLSLDPGNRAAEALRLRLNTRP